jgi:4a-hydroxytetrahydrobiopterin dehydratase
MLHAKSTKAKLTEDEITAHLSNLPGWTRAEETIRKTYQFADFTHALAFVNQVAETAEEVDHHPDIDVRYNKVTLALTTHHAGGLTLNDVDLAAVCDDFADGVGQ